MESFDERGVRQGGPARALALVGPRRSAEPSRAPRPRAPQLRLVPWSIGVRSRWGTTGRLRSSALVLRSASRERRFARHVPATSLVTAGWPFGRPLGLGATARAPIELHVWRTRRAPRGTAPTGLPARTGRAERFGGSSGAPATPRPAARPTRGLMALVAALRGWLTRVGRP